MSDAPTNIVEFTVSEISQAVKLTVETAFGHIRVRGEVGRLTRPGSGHLYFDLKDESAVISAVAWKGTTSRWRFQPEQGLEVVVTGRLTTFPGQSKYQIVVENVELAGVGALMALLEERRKKLLAEGLFDLARKQPIPYLPRVIGV
ncbi:MAG: exodeoxyribonuclease VII large subunit, partial [Cucumibacter sp.]